MLPKGAVLSSDRGVAKGFSALKSGAALTPNVCRYPLEGRGRTPVRQWLLGSKERASDLGREPEWPIGQRGR